jgi:hypothetical protein
MRCAMAFLTCLLLPFTLHAEDWVRPDQAAASVGKEATVRLNVAATGISTGNRFTFISKYNPSEEGSFLVLISPEAQEKFAAKKIADLGKQFGRKTVLVSGRITLVKYDFGVRPVIQVTEPDQIRLFDFDQPYPPGSEILALFRNGKLFDRTAYKELRAAFARRFEQHRDADIRKAFGADYDALQTWFGQNPDVKENLYSAILEEYDDVSAALTIFKDIWKEQPETLPKWSQLAIATAVTWDQREGIYEYDDHQRRVFSEMPKGTIGALENYKYLVDREKKMPLPVSLYPWEFLTFVVNHRTPTPERDWAFGYFQEAKSRTRSWHKDVPYDMEIIKREINRDPAAQKPKISGKDYTLANIKTFGGVCAHQADFACRTAKSLGVPAVYCSGESAYRDRHAWWMYIQVSNATKDDIKFVLVSDGRFDGFAKDNFYVGTVLDPQTGLQMLDRDMERRLWTAGTDRLGKRMSSMVMRLYTSIAAEEKFDAKEKVKYLDRCLKLSKYNEEAWVHFARLAKTGELSGENKKIVTSHLATLSTTFAAYPDFIWHMYEELLETFPAAERTKQLASIQAQFEKASRPDLACEARMKITELLIADSKAGAALPGLTTLVKKFPTEGRYIPKMLKLMEESATGVKTGPTQVASIYLDIVPAMIVYYGSDQNGYYRKMASQARAYLQQNNLTQMIATLDTRVEQAKLQAKKK